MAGTTVFQNEQNQPIQPQAETIQDHRSSIFSPGNVFKLLLGLFAVFALFIVVFGVVLPNLGSKNQKIEISYWGLFEEREIFTPIIDDFEKQNPNIKINYQKQELKDYRERLTTRIQNGTGPDIFRFHNTWYPMLAETFAPIPKETIDREEFNKSFYPVMQNDLIKNGGIIGIPLEIDTLSLFVNSDMLKATGQSIPTNWNDFVNASRALTVKDKDGKIKTAGAALGTYDNITHAGDLVSLLFAQDGVNLNDLSQTKQRVADALNFYTKFAVSESSVWDSTLDPSILSFSKGSLGMFFGYYWDYIAIKSANPSLSFTVVTVPSLSSQNITIASYWAEGLSVKSKHQKEALLFLKFLAKRETMEKLYDSQAHARSFGEPPSRVDLSSKLKGTPVSSFVDQAKNSTSSYFTGETLDNGLNSKVNNLLKNAINSILNNTSSDTASDGLSLGFSQVFQEYFKK